jgi:hypothetical protein
MGVSVLSIDRSIDCCCCCCFLIMSCFFQLHYRVPWGELVGEESFETLSKIYTGYGEDGPSQGKLHSNGMNDEMKNEFPKLDYINKCVVVDEAGSS